MGTIHCLAQHRAMKEAKAILDWNKIKPTEVFELDVDAMSELCGIVIINQNDEGGEEDGKKD